MSVLDTPSISRVVVAALAIGAVNAMAVAAATGNTHRVDVALIALS
jgi:hypothetical protein